jgi:hypothetical protein
MNKIILSFIMILFAGCSDKLNPDLLNGRYTGTFHYISPADLKGTSAPADVRLADGRYSSAGNEHYIPAGGSGTFVIKDQKFLEFKDENIWTANFDWGLILNGTYNYEVKADSLILTRYKEPCPTCDMTPSLYQYRLKRSD